MRSARTTTVRTLCLVLGAVSCSAAAPCSSSAWVARPVLSSEDIPDLIAASNCTGGNVTVSTWSGTVPVNNAIWVGRETTLTINGAGGLKSVADGSSSTRLFVVDARATLNLQGLQLQNGRAVVDKDEKNEGNYGGAIYVSGDNATVNLKDSNITGSVAAVYGGGVYVSPGGVLTIDGCIFENNSATIAGGGAVLGNTDSIIGPVTSSSFVNNSAGGSDGGAMWLSSHDAKIVISGCVFRNNTAIAAGGALQLQLYAGYSKIENCDFLNNTGYYGGALSTTYNGTLDITDSRFDSNTGGWGGAGIARGFWNIRNCTLQNNEAGSFGGGLYIGAYQKQQSQVTLASSRLRNNSATYGGGLSVDTNVLVKASDVLMEGNSAVLSGGAFFSAGTLDLLRCQFVGNKADVFGAGLFVSVSGNGAALSSVNCNSCLFQSQAARFGAAVYALSETVFDVTDSQWIGNNATSIGGALVTFSKHLLLTRCELTNNTGGQSGGAIYASSYSSTVLGEGTVFQGNAAQQGGAVFVEANSQLNVTGAVALQQNTATFGGAIYSAVPLSPLPGGSLSFTENSAGISGGSVFYENVSDPSYPSTVVFSGSDAKCCHPWSSFWATGCQDVDGSKAPTDVCCYGGYYSNGKDCISCPEALNCTEFGRTTESLALSRGYWRVSLSTQLVRKCWDPKACQGGAATTDPDEYCSPGYDGPYCAVCNTGYTQGIAYSCTKCTSVSKAGWSVFVAAITVLALLVLLGLLSELQSVSRVYRGAIRDSDAVFAASDAVVVARRVHIRRSLMRAGRFLRKLDFSGLRIPIVAMQILTQMVAIMGVRFPSPYAEFLAWVGAINFDLSWILSLSCLFNFSYHKTLLLVTLLPLCASACLGASYLVARLRLQRQHSSLLARKAAAKGQDEEESKTPPPPLLPPDPTVRRSKFKLAPALEEALDRLQSRHVRVLFVITFLVYSTTSTVIFQAFACDKFTEEEGGQSYLRADYSISCGTKTHQSWQVYAGIMILVYPIGVPLLYGWGLWRWRMYLSSPDRTERGMIHNPWVHAMRFLWTPYRKQLFWWELVECFRRLLLTGLLVFILPGSPGQVAVACVFAAMSLAVVAYASPFSDGLDASIWITGAVIIYLSAFLALALKVNVSSEDKQSARVMSVLLIVVTVLMIAAAVAQVVMASLAWRKNRKDSRANRVAASESESGRRQSQRTQLEEASGETKNSFQSAFHESGAAAESSGMDRGAPGA